MSFSQPLTVDQFRFVVQHAPLVSIDILLTDPAGSVLLGLRNNEPARGSWFVPGGVIFKGESVAAAFGRILAGETGLSRTLSQAEHIGVFDHFYDTNRFSEPGYGTHYVVNALRLVLPERPGVTPDDQHHAMQWMTPQKILASADVHSNTKAYFHRSHPA
jgi:colanic acid biosynthesis protein WcaH